MKFTISREELLPALQIVNGVVERRQTLPILSNLLLNVSSDAMRLTATDMEVEIMAKLSKGLPQGGEITLPARKLLDICRTLPDAAPITISVDGDRALVTSGKSRFTLATLPAQEYPLIEVPDQAASFSLSQSALKTLLDRTAFAMAQQDVRYYLNGLLLELGKGQVRAVATDGHRLALCEVDAEVSTEHPVKIIIPRKGVQELIRLLDDSDEVVKVLVSSNHVRIDLGSLRFTSKLIDGKFPDYERVIPEESEAPLLADRETLRQSLVRASILSNEKYRGVRITLAPNSLKALAHNPDQEEAEEEIEVQYSGAEMEVGFNVSYLLDALANIRTDQVRVTITDPNSSCLILPQGESPCRYVVMPMRL